jgi:hypothetical protein
MSSLDDFIEEELPDSDGIRRQAGLADSVCGDRLRWHGVNIGSDADRDDGCRPGSAEPATVLRAVQPHLPRFGRPGPAIVRHHRIDATRILVPHL